MGVTHVSQLLLMILASAILMHIGQAQGDSDNLADRQIVKAVVEVSLHSYATILIVMLNATSSTPRIYMLTGVKCEMILIRRPM